MVHFLSIFEIWASLCDLSFDVKFLKLFMLIGLFITYIEMQFVQKVDLRNVLDDLFQTLQFFLIRLV